MVKKYELLQDLPNAKKGAIYQLTDDKENYVCYDLISQRSWDVSYPKEYIENNTHFFKEIVTEPKIEDANRQVHEKVYNSMNFLSDGCEKFSLCMRDGGYEFFYEGEWYEAKKGKVSLRKTNPPTLNPDTSIPLKSSEVKDWDIVEFRAKNIPNISWKLTEDGRYMNNYTSIFSLQHLLDGEGDNSYSSVKNGGMYIFSVKRLSDNSIWTIGDKFGVHPCINAHEIKSFSIEGNLMVIHAEDFPRYKYPIVHLVKLLPTTPKDKEVSKEPLFVTEDGVEVFHGDKNWYVQFTTNHEIYSWEAFKTDEMHNHKLKYFSTEDKAKEYVLMHKPMFSINEIYVQSYCSDKHTMYYNKKDFIHLGKTKLSQQ